MLKLVTNGTLATLIGIVPWLAGKPVVRNRAIRIWLQRALQRVTLRWLGIVVLPVRQYRQSGGVRGLPGQAGGQVLSVVVDKIHLGFAVANQAHQANREGITVVHRPTDIKMALDQIVGTSLNAHFSTGVESRTFGHIVHQPTRARLSVQNGRRPLEHINALGAIGLQAVTGGKAGVRQFQVVTKQATGGHIEAAYSQKRGARLETKGLASGAGCITQNFAQVGRVLVLDLIRCDCGNGLGRFNHVGGCFRAGNGRLCGVAITRCGAARFGGICRYFNGIQLGNIRFLRVQYRACQNPGYGHGQAGRE